MFPIVLFPCALVIIRNMKVSELKLGCIYTPDSKTALRDNSHMIIGDEQNGVFTVTERMLWRSYKRMNPIEHGVYMYLGSTQDEWTIDPYRNIYKHHWFWINGEKMIVNNYSLRLLKEITYESTL